MSGARTWQVHGDQRVEHAGPRRVAGRSLTARPTALGIEARKASRSPPPRAAKGTAATNAGATHTAFFFSNPGSVHRATKSGTWGDARSATAEIGERFLGMAARATVRMLEDIEKTFAAMPPR